MNAMNTLQKKIQHDPDRHSNKTSTQCNITLNSTDCQMYKSGTNPYNVKTNGHVAFHAM
jgi:hypothetical protein